MNPIEVATRRPSAARAARHEGVLWTRSLLRSIYRNSIGITFHFDKPWRKIGVKDCARQRNDRFSPASIIEVQAIAIPEQIARVERGAYGRNFDRPDSTAQTVGGSARPMTATRSVGASAHPGGPQPRFRLHARAH